MDARHGAARAAAGATGGGGLPRGLHLAAPARLHAGPPPRLTSPLLRGECLQARVAGGEFQPAFGHACREQLFALSPQWTFINHGSYGGTYRLALEVWLPAIRRGHGRRAAVHGDGSLRTQVPLSKGFTHGLAVGARQPPQLRVDPGFSRAQAQDWWRQQLEAQPVKFIETEAMAGEWGAGAAMWVACAW